jgi:hypothetical protein
LYQGLTLHSALTFAKDLGTNDITPENTFDLARETATGTGIPALGEFPDLRASAGKRLPTAASPRALPLLAWR